MEAVPLAMGRVARAWDEQHLDLAAAADQLGDAPTAGFTSGAAGAAARVASTWQRHLTELGDTAEARADGLRTSAADYLRTDTAAASRQVLLGLQLREIR